MYYLDYRVAQNLVLLTYECGNLILVYNLAQGSSSTQCMTENRQFAIRLFRCFLHIQVIEIVDHRW